MENNIQIFNNPSFGEVKKVKGLDDIYVSSNGNVLLLVNNHYTIKKTTKANNGYLYVKIKYKNYRVHRLIAKTFISNINNFPYVNHKDEDKTNNNVSNLEWCSASYNINYGSRNERVSDKMKNNKYTSLAVAQYDLNNIHIATYPSLSEAERITNIDSTLISRCCRGIQLKTKGFIFKYV